jgi:hypothetical protein
MSSDDDGKTGRLRGWWSRRSSYTRKGIIILGIILWAYSTYSMGYSHGVDSAIELDNEEFQLSIVNYTISPDPDGFYRINGEIQNNYEEPVYVDSIWIAGFDSSEDRLCGWVFAGSKLQPGEKKGFKGHIFEKPPQNFTFGLQTRARLQ